MPQSTRSYSQNIKVIKIGTGTMMILITDNFGVTKLTET